MLRLHKHRQPPKSGTKIDFKFSGFTALQVPKGWDKLVVSVVSVETGKTVSKTSKAAVRNGSCQWNETLSESIRISEDDSSKEMEDCLFKFIVSMGSARSGILGEATVNMTDYTSTSASIPLSLLLKKCSHGTTLQVQIQCVTPRTKSRDDHSKEKNSDLEKTNGNCHDIDIKSDGSGSDSTFARSFRSSSKDFHLTSHLEEPGSRETSFSISESHQSYDSAEGFVENMSLRDHGGDMRRFTRSEDSISSENSVAHGNYLSDNHHLKQSSFNSQIMGSGNHSADSRQEFTASSLTTTTSKNFLEAAEDTIEELRAEAKMWERNARKLMLDLDILRVEFSDQSKTQENLNMELSAACAERDGLKKEVEQLKFSFDNSMVKQMSSEDLASQDEGLPHIQKELKDELKFQKESNSNLALQLKRSHESNIELVSVLQELEDTIERQKMEIDNLLVVESKFSDMEKTIEANVEENRKLKEELQHLQESEKNLKEKVQLLGQALEEKNQGVENLNSRTFRDIEMEFKSQLLDKEEEIVNLKAKLSESLNVAHSFEVGSTNDSDVNLMRELEVLKEKVQELEGDCNELTEENLELLFKLKESKNDLNRRDTSFDFQHSESLTNSLTSFDFQLSDQKFKTNYAEEKLEKKGTTKDDNNSVQVLRSLEMELEANLEEMDMELAEKRTEMERLQLNLLSKEKEILVLKQCQSELEAEVSDLRKEKVQLQEHVEVRLQETDVTSKRLNDLQQDLVVITSSVDSHASANKILERMSSELGTSNREMELHVSELEGENVQLSVLVASLEAQLRYLTNEQESSQLELENSKSHALSLQYEINRLRIEMAAEKVELRKKLQNMQNQFSETQEECDYLRRENSNLQSNVERLVRECNTFQKLNGELRDQKLELHDRCAHLEEKLEESHKSFTDCSRKVDELEQYLSSLMAEIASKEKSLTSEIDALLDENLRHKEKFNQEQGLLNQMYMEKAVEVENFQQEVQHLVKKLSETYEERDRIASDAMQELSKLRAENKKLESDFQEIQSKSKQTENELNIKQIDYELKLKSLSGELGASNRNHELLMADHEKISKLLENYKSGEGKFKTLVNDLELRLTVSEYERQKLVEESSNLKVKLQKLAHLEGDLVAFKKELDTTKFEKEKLEESMQTVSEECKNVKAEKNELLEKISMLNKAVSELEEKLLQMEADLVEKDALLVQGAELKNELNQISRENRQYQEERDECQRKFQALEEEVKLLKEEKQNQREHSGRKASNISKTNAKVNPVHETARFPKNEMAKTGNQRRDYKRNGLVQEVKKDPHRTQSQKENGNGCESPNGSPHHTGADAASKVQLLEDQLAKALEETNKHKLQLNRKSTPEGEVVSKEKYECTKSSLEAELRDIRERYSDMSLKYAEVEALREELVMKLKTAKSGKRWFSMNS